ncbi:glycosyltransferase family 4 protein [Demequina sp.]|uniref:glycosyltransferase family 4 protein n=1 Tax=Demequina sp. TaxID=2050685 RepID=UPI003A85AD53
MTDVVVNGAFRPQRVTGQQRYATEIANRLLSDHDFDELVPDGRWAGSAAKEWAWTLGRLPTLARGRTLVSLTSRAPARTPQVLVVHDLFVLTHPEWYSRRYIATHAPALRAQVRAAAAVVSVSEPAAREVRDRFGVDVRVAPNAPSAVFAAGDAEPDAAVLASLGLRRRGYVLTVGNLEPRKNLSRLARAYGSLPATVRQEIPLIVVGGGASIYRDVDGAWPEGMRAAGYVTDAELASLYRGTLAVAMPSLAEGFGLPLVEAAAAGAPALVVSDIPVFRWICADTAHYVDPHSVESIAEGLRLAIDGLTPTQAVDLRRFDWDASASVVAQAALDCTARAR